MVNVLMYTLMSAIQALGLLVVGCWPHGFCRCNQTSLFILSLTHSSICVTPI